jgi:hypothetical protein
MKIKSIGSTEFHPGIRIDSISAQGFPGLLFAAATWLTFAGGIPAAREFMAITGALGLGFAGLLYWWHNQTRW